MTAKVSQLPAQLDAECVAGDPFTIAVTSSGATITSPTVTLKTSLGATVTGTVPTVTQVGAVTTIAFSAATTAALNTNTTQPVSLLWSLSALVNGQGPFQLVARRLTIYPVGTAKTSSTSSAALAVTVGSTAVSLAVTLGSVNGEIEVGPPTGGNDTTVIQDVLNAAAAIASPNRVSDYADGLNIRVKLVSGYVYSAIGLTVPVGVCLDLNGSTIKTPTGTSGTLVTIQGVRSTVTNGQMLGNGPGGAGTYTEGVLVANTSEFATVTNLTFRNFGGPAIRLEGPVAWLDSILITNACMSDSLFAGYTGAIHITSNDNFLSSIEVGTGRNSLGKSPNGYVCAVFLNAANNRFINVLAEASDVGFYIGVSGVRCMFATCMAEINRTHGWQILGTGVMSSCFANNNSQETTNTWDGFNFANNSKFSVVGCRAENPMANKHRYGFYDATNGTSNFNTFSADNLSIGHTTAPLFVENFAGSKVTPLVGPFVAIAAAATTQDVQVYGWPYCMWNLSSTGAVNFTDFTNGVTGQVLYVCGDGFSTFVHDTGVLRTTTGANKLAAANTIYRFINRNGVWFEF
jgi:hypothetical protein